MTIKVLIVDDQKTVQEIIKSYIEDEPGLELVGCANDGQEALDIVEANRPNIVLMDIEMPVLDGLTATKIISEQFVDTGVLVISVHNEENYINTALRVGAKGYLLKNTPARELINAIYSAYKGYFQLGPGLLEKYLHRATEATLKAQELEQLKNMMLEQFQNTNQNASQPDTGQRNGSRQQGNSRSMSSLEHQYTSLERQTYILSNRIDKLNKKINSIQQFLVIVVLCCIVSMMLFLIIAKSNIL